MAEDQTSRVVDIATAAIAAHKVARTVVDQEVGKARRHIKTRKSATTRQRIITAAIELMMEHGNTDFQMREVSDRCHMSKGSIYYYFSDKDELIEEIFDEGSQGMIAAVEDVIAKADTAYEGLVNLVAEFAHQIRMSNPLVIALAREVSRPSKGGSSILNSRYAQLVRIITAQIDRAKAEGSVRQDLNSGLAAIFLTGGFLSTSVTSVGSQIPMSDEEFVGDLLHLAMGGIGTPADEG